MAVFGYDVRRLCGNLKSIAQASDDGNLVRFSYIQTSSDGSQLSIKVKWYWMPRACISTLGNL